MESDQIPLAYTRRQFLAALPAMAALAQSKSLTIAAVQAWEVRGHPEAMRGIDQQHQVTPVVLLTGSGTPLIIGTNRPESVRFQ